MSLTLPVPITDRSGPLPCKNSCFQQKYLYSESVLNFSYVYDVIETTKEVLAGLKFMLTFLSRATNTPSFTFFSDKSHTEILLILLSKKHY